VRRAKRAQRGRELAAGLVYVHLKLDRTVATKLVAAACAKDFPEQLGKLLDEVVVRVQDYPALEDLMWHRNDQYVSALEAFQIYERNWRFIDQALVDANERDLIRRLTERFGAGVINA